MIPCPLRWERVDRRRRFPSRRGTGSRPAIQDMLVCGSAALSCPLLRLEVQLLAADENGAPEKGKMCNNQWNNKRELKV